MDDVVIRVEGVSKSFKLPHEKHGSFKSLLLNLFRGSRSYEQQVALKDISIEIKKGEFFGIVGRNGSGKSTLLKLLAGIYSLDSGAIQVNGQLTPFIELGVGFNPELTGRENVFLNGALLGFDRKQMSAMYDEIVEFAELERFMDQKLKNYSSGMQVRLAFSIAIRAKSDILLIDEVLAVGDLDFQKKCYQYFIDLKKREQTVILVTHDMSAVRRYCDRSMLINDGKVQFIGPPSKAAEQYEIINLRTAEKRLNALNKEPGQGLRDGDGGAKIIGAQTVVAKTKKIQNTFSPSENIVVRLTFKAEEDIADPILGFIFQDEQDVTVFATNTQVQKVKTKSLRAGETVILETLVDNIFTDGSYTITAAIEGDNFFKVYDRIKYMHTFIVGGQPLAHARTHPNHKSILSYPTNSKADKS